jgi:hypothetical protein
MAIFMGNEVGEQEYTEVVKQTCNCGTVDRNPARRKLSIGYRKETFGAVKTQKFVAQVGKQRAFRIAN